MAETAHCAAPKRHRIAGSIPAFATERHLGRIGFSSALAAGMHVMFSNVKEAKQAIVDFQTSYLALLSSQSAEQKAFKTGAHQATYEGLGNALRVALALLESPEVMVGLLSDNNEKAAGVGENPFSPIVRMLYRKPLKGGGTTSDKSAWKYAGVLRYCRDRGWKPEQVADMLNGLQEEIDGVKRTKMLCAELLDRAKYRDGEEEAKFRDYAFQHLLEQPGFGTFPGDAVTVKSRENGTWISVAAVWNEAIGQWVIHQVANTISDAVKKQISAKVVKSFKDHNSKLFLDLALHNEEMDKLNEEAYATKRWLNDRREAEDAAKAEEPVVEDEQLADRKSVV